MPGVKLTYEDLVRLPDDGLRHELIDGELIVTPSPLPVHERVVRNLTHALETHVRAQDLGWVFGSQTIRIDNFDALQPDILLLSKAQTRTLDIHSVIRVAPSLVIEVSSPSTRQFDQIYKRELYDGMGVLEYWFVDIPASSVIIYHRTASGAAFASPATLSGQNELLTTPLLPGFQLPLAALFDLRRPTGDT